MGDGLYSGATAEQYAKHRGVIPIPMYQNLSLLADKRVVTVRLWYLGIWMIGGRWQETVKIQPVGNEPNKILT